MIEQIEISRDEISRSRLPDTDYVVIILDLWRGDRTDPAVGVSRYMYMCTADLAPTDDYPIEFSYREYEIKRSLREHVLIFKKIKDVKNADREAQEHQSYDKMLLDPEQRRYSMRQKGDAYEKFLEAIDKLSENYEDKEAWAAVEQWRELHAMAHEK